MFKFNRVVVIIYDLYSKNFIIEIINLIILKKKTLSRLSLIVSLA